MRIARLALLAPALLVCACEPLDLGGGAGGVGGRIAFIRDGALITSSDTGDDETIITDPGTSADPVLSSNGASVVFAFSAAKDDSGRALRIVASSGGTPMAIVEPVPGEGFASPAFSRDGRTIAFVAVLGASSTIRTVPVSGGPSFPVAGGHDDLHFPAFLDDTTLLVSKGASLELCTLDLTSGQLTPLGLVSPSRAAVSPDGKRIAYASGSPAAILIRELATGMETPLASTGHGDVNPAFSPDGRFVAFDAQAPGESQPKIYAADSAGSDGITLLQAGSSVSWGL